MYICMYVCMYACMHVCMYVCEQSLADIRREVKNPACFFSTVCIYVCMYVCCEFIYTVMEFMLHLSDVCVQYVDSCMYVDVCVCMCVYMNLYTHGDEIYATLVRCVHEICRFLHICRCMCVRIPRI
jgi:hypothetical protein